MKKAFITKRFAPESTKLLQTIDSVLVDYQGQGYTLTLRQLYYQLVSRDLIVNSIQSYKRIGNLVNDARLAGLIDWDMIEDRGRIAKHNPHWESPADIIISASQQFQIDKWENQPCYFEVMVEKDALSGVLLPVCQKLDIRFTANKGYSSSSALYEAGNRIIKALDNDKEVHIIYLGDHDPSGLDMTRDIRERVRMFTETDDIPVDRLALNWDQVEILKPPENPAKETDSRYANYVDKYGESSWELDAIEPRQLDAIVTEHVINLRDELLWQEAQDKENGMKYTLRRMAEEYDDDTESGHG